MCGRELLDSILVEMLIAQPIARYAMKSLHERQAKKVESVKQLLKIWFSFAYTRYMGLEEANSIKLPEKRDIGCDIRHIQYPFKYIR